MHCWALPSWKRLANRTNGDPALKRIRVLIADPDRCLVASYRDFLSRTGIDVVTATNGLECVAALRAFATDVVVLEPELLWGRGEDVLAMMCDQVDVPMVPVIILSTCKNAQTLDALPAFPICDHGTKPLSPEQLADRICKLVLYHRVGDSLSKEAKAYGMQAV